MTSFHKLKLICQLAADFEIYASKGTRHSVTRKLSLRYGHNSPLATIMNKLVQFLVVYFKSTSYW